MPRYFIQVSDGTKQHREISARDDEEATVTALAALGMHISRTFPPPASVKIVVMDEQFNERATLRFSYETPKVRSLSRRLQ